MNLNMQYNFIGLNGAHMLNEIYGDTYYEQSKTSSGKEVGSKCYKKPMESAL